MFWERADSKLADDQLRELKYRQISIASVKAAISDSVSDLVIPSPIAGGTFSRTFKLSFPNGSSQYVARMLINPSPNLQAFHLEQWVNNEAISRGFFTPQIVCVDTSFKKSSCPFQIIKLAEGNQLRDSDEYTIRKVLSQVGIELFKLHSGNIGNRYGRVGIETYHEWDIFWTNRLEWHIDYCLGKDIITDEQADRMRDLFENTIFDLDKPSLLHGDLSYDNILVQDGNLSSIIDWEDAVLGDPIFELAGLATFHPESRHSSFLDAYYNGASRPDNFHTRFWTYYLRIALAKAIHRHRFGYNTNLKPGYQDPNDRIRLALSKLSN